MTLSIILKGKPESINALYRTLKNSGAYYMTPKAKQIKLAYVAQANAQVRQQGRQKTSKPLEVEVILYFPDNRRRDWDNYHKLAQDSLEGIVFEDDSQIQKATIWKKYDKLNPRIEYIFHIIENHDA